MNRKNYVMQRISFWNECEVQKKGSARSELHAEYVEWQGRHSGVTHTFVGDSKSSLTTMYIEQLADVTGTEVIVVTSYSRQCMRSYH